ncbi:hypothetical protein X927_05495 [Petrotoga mexicana DSM 14811]|uniref:Uncharacterized protein n=1 Tax=Petrotoga mexicana DSM 14811 TaxID=1122954 RepID=A0A2K1P9L5_9BACT|nr:hypothetical protein X927_05495 [Petrotoga mexicana DSM 14811]
MKQMSKNYKKKKRFVLFSNSIKSCYLELVNNLNLEKGGGKQIWIFLRN